MSGAVKAIVGAVLIVVGAVLIAEGVPWGAWLVKAGGALWTAAALSLFIKAPRAPPIAGVSINYSGTLEPRRILYGNMKIGGINCLPPLTSGPNNDYMHQVLAFGGEQISGYGDVYFNQTRIANASIGALPTGLVTAGVYANKAWIRRYDGSQVAVDATLASNFSAWDANHVGYGIPYAAIMLQWDQAVYSSGFPQITFVVQGKKIYDPRLDSTNGGSGSQRYATPSTWTYSTNPALCLRDYLTSALGLNEAQTRIDDTLVAAAANICDQTVAVPIPVLVGLTNWTNGSTSVTGINTSFLLALTSGAYLKAPNGAMVQISGVPTDDTHLTLAGAYGGANASGQVTQYNNASNATSTTQPRYTCNTILDATATFNTNIGILIGAMMGHCLYSAGKWRMYAGAWSGSAFSLGPDDIIGNVQVQCGTPRANLYNAVRGNFLDPQQNYAASEFPPIINAAYAAADGETIYIETNFPCCVDRYEAQRNAIIYSRQGRNQKTVTIQCGMSAFGVKIYETGTVTLPEIGWNAQSVRAIGWRFNPQGMIELGLQEAYSADFTDPLVGDYAITGVNVGPQAGKYIPYPPTNLVATSVAGGINFKVTLPSQTIPGTRIQIFEYTANTPFASSTLVAVHAADNFFIPKFDTVTRYYWARTLSPQEQVSSTYPAGNGVAGVALTPNQAWDAIGNLLSLTAPNGWALPGGGGSVGNWNQINSSAGGSNLVVLAGDPANGSPLGPFWHTEPLWRAVGGTGGGQEGWTNSADLTVPPIDPHKTYRATVWFQYAGATGGGSIYFGLDTAGSIKNLSPGTVDSNPLFLYGPLSNLTIGHWYLLVGIVHSCDYTGADTGASGVYDPATGDFITAFNGFANGANVSGGVDFRFASGSITGTLLHSYEYNVTSASNKGYWARPRFEMMDGQEPSVRDLLSPGVVDPTLTPRQIIAHTGPVPRHGILPTGNIPPMVQDANFTYTSTTTSLTFSWTAYLVYRPDGTSFSMTAGSQAVTGLGASTSYAGYAYSNESAPATMAFETSFAGSTGSPAILFNLATATQAQLSAAFADASLLAKIYQGKLAGVTPAAGTGGGGGGGGGFGCPHPTQRVVTSAGLKHAGQLALGDELLTPGGWSPIVGLARREQHEWIAVWFDNDAFVTVSLDHRFVAPDGDQVKASELRLGQILATGGPRNLRVTSLRLREEDDLAVSIELADPHTYLLVADGPLSHNLKP